MSALELIQSIFGANLQQQNNNDNIETLRQCMLIEFDLNELDVLDQVDVTDQTGTGPFVLATIIENDALVPSRWKLHFDPSSKLENEWIDYEQDQRRFAKAKSISLRKAHRLQYVLAGDAVAINPLLTHPGWKEGKIVKRSLGQVQVSYEFDGDTYLYWVHLDGETEIDSIKNNHKNESVVNKQPSDKADIMPLFESHMSLSEASTLRLHDKVDHRDQVGRFVYATISEKTGTILKIHYDGWSRKWDTWSDYQNEKHRFAKAGSISKRQAHRFRHLKKGDYVDINPTQRHPGWKCGEIQKLGQKSGQVQVVYECADNNYLYWAHLDNPDEIAEFSTKSGTVHSVQKNVKKHIAAPKKRSNEMKSQTTSVERLIAMGFTSESIDRAIKTCDVKDICSVERLAALILKQEMVILKQGMDGQQNNNNDKYTLPQCKLTASEANKLEEFDQVDVTDDDGCFVLATIVRKSDLRALWKIRFDPSSKLDDEWVNHEEQWGRFAKARSISQRKAHRMQNVSIGDVVAINPLLKHHGWKKGTIVQRIHGQVQVSYVNREGKTHLYWVHLDWDNEIDFMKARNVLSKCKIERKRDNMARVSYEYMGEIYVHWNDNLQFQQETKKGIWVNDNIYVIDDEWYLPKCKVALVVEDDDDDYKDSDIVFGMHYDANHKTSLLQCIATEIYGKWTQNNVIGMNIEIERCMHVNCNEIQWSDVLNVIDDKYKLFLIVCSELFACKIRVVELDTKYKMTFECGKSKDDIPTILLYYSDCVGFRLIEIKNRLFERPLGTKHELRKIIGKLKNGPGFEDNNHDLVNGVEAVLNQKH